MCTERLSFYKNDQKYSKIATKEKWDIMIYVSAKYYIFITHADKTPVDRPPGWESVLLSLGSVRCFFGIFRNGSCQLSVRNSYLCM